jgi:multisubunit Na+/H+ antiporter MnhE subunit
VVSEWLEPRTGVGVPRRREQERRFASRVGSWLLWWVGLTAFWIVLDYSLNIAELLVGAAAAAVTALFVELVEYQADTYFRIRWRWLVLAVRLPVRVVRDTVIVFAALWRCLAHGQYPTDGFVEIPVRGGGESATDVTRRALLVGAHSLAPNTFVLGLDREQEVMVVHHLVPPRRAGAGATSREEYR